MSSNLRSSGRSYLYASFLATRNLRLPKVRLPSTFNQRETTKGLNYSQRLGDVRACSFTHSPFAACLSSWSCRRRSRRGNCSYFTLEVSKDEREELLLPALHFFVFLFATLAGAGVGSILLSLVTTWLSRAGRFNLARYAPSFSLTCTVDGYQLTLRSSD